MFKWEVSAECGPVSLSLLSVSFYYPVLSVGVFSSVSGDKFVKKEKEKKKPPCA